MSLECSVILPAYNEGQGLVPLVERLAEVLEDSGRTFEILLVDDGSKDDTWEIINELSCRHPQVRALRFARNFGHQLAVHAGVKASRGEMISIMDSDGQDPPELLPKIFDLLDEGHDVVCCVRTDRKESGLIKLCYFLFYRLYSRLVPFAISLDSGDFCGMNRRTADIVARIDQHTPFIRGLRSWAGGSQIELPYERLARQSGTTKYGILKLFLLAMNGITAFSKVPLRMSIIAGLIISFGSVLYAVSVVVLKILTGYPEDSLGWASLATLIAFLGGAQLTALGIMGEYLGHIFDAVLGIPPFRVVEQIGFDDDTVGLQCGVSERG